MCGFLGGRVCIVKLKLHDHCVWYRKTAKTQMEKVTLGGARR